MSHEVLCLDGWGVVWVLAGFFVGTFLNGFIKEWFELRRRRRGDR